MDSTQLRPSTSPQDQLLSKVKLYSIPEFLNPFRSPWKCDNQSSHLIDLQKLFHQKLFHLCDSPFCHSPSFIKAMGKNEALPLISALQPRQIQDKKPKLQYSIHPKENVFPILTRSL